MASQEFHFCSGRKIRDYNKSKDDVATALRPRIADRIFLPERRRRAATARHGDCTIQRICSVRAERQLAKCLDHQARSRVLLHELLEIFKTLEFERASGHGGK